MFFWLMMSACNLLLPLIMLILGLRYERRPPKKINGMSGYSTAMSIKNIDTWTFAHKYCGKLWWQMGAAVLPLSIAVSAAMYFMSEDWQGRACCILIFAQCAVLIASIYLTEAALRKNFNKYGNPK